LKDKNVIDFLSLEGKIMDRLRERCPSARAVVAVDGLREALDKAQFSPLLAVVYNGYKVTSSAPLKNSVMTEQRYLVVGVAKSARQNGRNPADARAAAGPVCGEALAALMGWQPEGIGPGAKALTLESGPTPVYHEGVSMIPLAFSAQVNITVPLEVSGVLPRKI
jgi:hypothetical protein